MFKKKKDKKIFYKKEMYYWPRTVYDYPAIRELLEKEEENEKPV